MESAARAKGKMQCGCPSLRPGDGTQIREVYDLFMANKGLPITFACSSKDRSYRKVEDLRDYYGLDIRRLSRGRWVLAGEWFGKTYVDYIADRIAQAERRQ